MPQLSRWRENDRRQESWHLFDDGVRVGWIGERAGVPKDLAQWGWNCGFSPASDRGIRQDGVAETFDQARATFADAWESYLPRCT